jgi:hypothetical protein
VACDGNVNFLDHRRTAQLNSLETKLEDIALALTSKRPQASLATTDTTVTPHTISASAGDLQFTRAPRDASSSTDNTSQATTEFESETRSFTEQVTVILFDRYKRLMAPTMPFVILPIGSDALALTKSEPILMQAITIVASLHDSAKQRLLAKDVMRQLCEKLLINGEKTLGLLQALLVLLNWYNPHHFFPHNTTNHVHLAMALATNLNIDRGPGPSERAQIEAAVRSYGFVHPAKSVSNDERRAVLGIFYLASMNFTAFRKVDLLKWTPWHTQCAEALSEAKEYESDVHLVQLVQMQRIMQEAMSAEYSAPSQIYAMSFLGDLERLSIAPAVNKMATILRLQQACTRIAIWQRSFAGLTPGISESSDLRKRLDGMWSCMEAVKAYLRMYLEVPVEDYLIMPFVVVAQFAYTFGVMLRAVSIDMVGWDTRTLREYIDFSMVMGDAAHRFEAVSQSSVDGIPVGNDAFRKWAMNIRRAKTFYDNRFSLNISDERRQSQHLPTSLDVPMVMDSSLSSFLNFEDFWYDANDPLYFSVDPGFGL